MDKSLVQVGRDGPEPRYGMLETVQHYGQELVREARETATLRGRHSEAFLDLAERAYEERFERDEAWCAALEADHGNLSLALELRGADAERYLRATSFDRAMAMALA